MKQEDYSQFIVSAEDNIEVRQFFDSLESIEELLKYSDCPDVADQCLTLRNRYNELLQKVPTLTAEELSQQSDYIYRHAFELLQMALDALARNHPETSDYATALSQRTSLQPAQVLALLKELSTMNIEDERYYKLLDDLFLDLLCLTTTDEMYQQLNEALYFSHYFTRATLVSALLLGLLFRFSPAKVKMLIAMGKCCDTDSDTQRQDLKARVAVALTIICERYEHFLPLYPDLSVSLHDFFQQELSSDDLTALLNAFSCQRLVEEVGKEFKKFSNTIQGFIAKQLKRKKNGEKADQDDNTHHKTGTANINGTNIQFISFYGELPSDLSDLCANHSRHVEELRERNMDINATVTGSLKVFPFFKHTAHWFYPFTIYEPTIRPILTLPDGRLDRFNLEIIHESHFCASDCYSLFLMLEKIRSEANGPLHDIQQFIESQSEETNDMMNMLPNDTDFSPNKLTPYHDYCQSLHRYFNMKSNQINRSFHPFDNSSCTQLLKLSSFDGLFTSYDELQPSVDAQISMGDYLHAGQLVDYAHEHFRASSKILFDKGLISSRYENWEKAVESFQQSLLIEDNPDTVLQLARCYESMACWDKALPLLLKEEQRQTEANEKQAAAIIRETGTCLMKLKKWDEAVQRFFHLELLQRHLKVAKRSIAWCSIQQGKYERAIQYYRSFIDQRKATWEDLLNYGHALWLEGLTADAIVAYRQSRAAFLKANTKQRKDYEEWDEAFLYDTDMLLDKHFSPAASALMLDAVKSKPANEK